MNQSELKTLTNKRDFFKGLLIGACILWIGIVAAAFYFYFKTGNVALFVPIFGLIVVFIPIFQRFKILDGEIKSKKLN